MGQSEQVSKCKCFKKTRARTPACLCLSMHTYFTCMRTPPQVSQYWEDDFMRDHDLRQELETFKNELPSIIGDPSHLKAAIQLLSQHMLTTPIHLLQSRSQSHASLKSGPMELDEEDIRQRFPHLLTSLDSSDTGLRAWNILRHKPSDIGDQITLMDHMIFTRIRPRELVGGGWKKKNKWERSPHVLHMIGQFNSMSKLVQLVILNSPTSKEQQKLIKHWIQIGMQLKKRQDFSSLCSVHAAITSSVVQKCRNAWASLKKDKKTMKSLEEISVIFSWRSSALKQLHVDVKGPVVPHLGTILHSLMAIEEGDTRWRRNPNPRAGCRVRCFTPSSPAGSS